MKTTVFLILSITISSCGGISDSTEELGEGYYLASESNVDDVIVYHGIKAGDQFIPSNIIQYKFDNEFIIAKQQPTDECFWDDDTNEYKYGLDSFYFWVIIKNKNEIIGPLSRIEFNKTILEYKIPNKLVHEIK